MIKVKISKLKRKTYVRKIADKLCVENVFFFCLFPLGLLIENMKYST